MLFRKCIEDKDASEYIASVYCILYSRSDGCFTDELAVEKLPVKLET